MHIYYIHIVSNSPRDLYIGVINNIAARLAEHHAGTVETTASFGAVRLVYLEHTSDAVQRLLARNS